MKKIDFMLMLSCVSSLAMFTTAVAAQSLNDGIASKSTAVQSVSESTVATNGNDLGPG